MVFIQVAKGGQNDMEGVKLRTGGAVLARRHARVQWVLEWRLLWCGGQRRAELGDAKSYKRGSQRRVHSK